MSDPISELDQALPIARALAEQDAKVIGTFYVTLKAEIQDDYDVLELTHQYLATRFDRDE